MVFQWYIFVLLAVVAMMATALGMKYTVNMYGQKEKHYNWAPVFAIIVPLIYWAGARKDGFGDTSAYRIGFRNLPSTLASLPEAITDTTKDKGFTVFSVVIKSIIGNNDVLYFLIIAAICLLCVGFVYKKYSCSFIISMFLFVASGDYIQWTHNGIRQFIAVAIIFASTDFLLEKKYVKYIAIILLASTIHASALIMIPICFIVQGKPWNKKTLLLLGLVLLATAYVDSFTDIITNFMENSQYSGEVDQYLSTAGTNMLRVLVFSIPAVFSLIFKRRIELANNPLINLCVGMSIATMGSYFLSAYTSGLFLGRIPIYFSLYNYILLPWEIENVFTKKSAKIIYIMMFMFYLFFYYYQVDVTWGL